MLDETGKAKDGGQQPPGPSLQEGATQTSSVEQLTSAIEEGKQYAGADVLKLVKDALSADGREQKDRADKAETEVQRLTGAHNELTTQFNTVSGQVTQLLKDQDDAELAKYSDDKPAQDSLRARQANRAERIRLEGVDASIKTREAKVVADRETLNQQQTSISIKLAALAGGVDEKALADLVPDGDPGRLTKMAGILKQSGQTNTQQLDEQGRVKADKDGKEIPVALRQKPASGISAGGETKTTAERMLDKAKKK